MNGRLIRDDDGRVFRIPYGKAEVESFSVEWIGSDGGWRMAVFPGLTKRTDTAVEQKPQRVAQA